METTHQPVPKEGEYDGEESQGRGPDGMEGKRREGQIEIMTVAGGMGTLRVPVGGKMEKMSFY